MRTVSFSQPDVRNLLDRDFVCFHTSSEGDPSAGESIRHRPTDPAGPCVRGNGTPNVQILFLTPDGHVFHVVSGFVSAGDLFEEMQFAKNVFDELKQDSAGRSSRNPESIVIQSHRKRLTNLGFGDDQIDSKGFLPGGMAIPDFREFMMSGNQLKPSGNPAATLFDSMIRRQVLTDHQFCMRYPLISSEDFERDPTILVGSGKSFFMSSSGGN